MRFAATLLPGVFELELERNEDERGFFARSWCAQEFAAHGLPDAMVQGNVSHNVRKGTLRGLHLQWPPSNEGKLVRCEHGAVYDVVVDMRPDSRTFLVHHAVELEAERGNAIYVPPGLAHGFQTLKDESRVAYLMSDFFAPDLAGGFRYDDPAFGIAWPLPVAVISDRDRGYPCFDRERHAERIKGGWK